MRTRTSRPRECRRCELGCRYRLSIYLRMTGTLTDAYRLFYLSSAPLTLSAARSTNGLPSLLLTYASTELALHRSAPDSSRVVHVGEHFVAMVPYWAAWPFEVLVIPHRRHVPSIAYLTADERLDFARTLTSVGRRYDNLFECSFAYSMGLYQAPVYRPSADLSVRDAGMVETDGNVAAYTQLHVGFYPPLLRSSTVKKYLVGFELFAETQRDITPEQAAQRLRANSEEVHYKRAAAVAKE